MSTLPYIEIGIISLMPTPACIVVLKRKKSIIECNFESLVYCLNLVGILLSKCVEK
jgi:hypothetical protein